MSDISCIKSPCRNHRRAEARNKRRDEQNSVLQIKKYGKSGEKMEHLMNMYKK
jgi:hypothetical protein